MSRRNPERHRRSSTLVPPHLYEEDLLGPWRAQVVDNTDAAQRGRLTVTIHELTGDARYPILAEPKLAPMGAGLTDGKKWGSLFLPPVGAWVNVEFRDGDPEAPVWTPGWLGDGEIPDLLATNYPLRSGTVTPSGHALVFDDSDGDDGAVLVQQRDGAALTLAGDGSASLLDKQEVGIASDADGNLTVKAKAGQKVTVSVGGLSIVIDDGAGKITIDGTGKDIELKAKTLTITVDDVKATVTNKFDVS